jgi:upstream activation factor subunit UAF30
MAKAAKKAATKSIKQAATKTPAKSATKVAAKAPKKAAAKSGSKASGNGGGKGNPAFMAPLTVDAELGKVVGTEPLPRTEIIKKMWDYIRANNLQDQKNRRMINADDNLKPIFDGNKQASMFELAKYINNHVKK